MRGNQKDEFVLRIGGTMRDVEEDGREGIEHGGYILIGGIPLDQGEVFLSIFERDGDVFQGYGQKRGVGRGTTYDQKNGNIITYIELHNSNGSKYMFRSWEHGGQIRLDDVSGHWLVVSNS